MLLQINYEVGGRRWRSLPYLPQRKNGFPYNRFVLTCNQKLYNYDTNFIINFKSEYIECIGGLS